ncbi:MAG: hypothetical protein ACI9RG_001039 [Sulfurimonas sp.]|jgi:hypothetical protein|uniref:hypothetical protein n=1 Tax=Sulfurimonas sp. TaxID=2022749 RepID=UPI0025EA1EE8|nr:hypothetical protein [Sulfurimonas sp.]
MFKIIIEKECKCFVKSDFQNGIELESKDDALMKSIEMRNQMNDEFCGEHEFKVQEAGRNFVIAFAESTSNGCCGGGCGSH